MTIIRDFNPANGIANFANGFQGYKGTSFQAAADNPPRWSVVTPSNGNFYNNQWWKLTGVDPDDAGAVDANVLAQLVSGTNRLGVINDTVVVAIPLLLRSAEFPAVTGSDPLGKHTVWQAYGPPYYGDPPLAITVNSAHTQWRIENNYSALSVNATPPTKTSETNVVLATKTLAFDQPVLFVVEIKIGHWTNSTTPAGTLRWWFSPTGVIADLAQVALTGPFGTNVTAPYTTPTVHVANATELWCYPTNYRSAGAKTGAMSVYTSRIRVGAVGGSSSTIDAARTEVLNAYAADATGNAPTALWRNGTNGAIPEAVGAKYPSQDAGGTVYTSGRTYYAGFQNDPWNVYEDGGATITVVSDADFTGGKAYNFHHTANTQRPNNGDARCELVPNGGDFHDGDERWFCFEFKAQSYTPTTGAVILHQLKANNVDYGPPLQIVEGWNNANFRIDNSGAGGSNANAKTNFTYGGPVRRTSGGVNKVIVGYVISPDPNVALVTFIVDGVTIFQDKVWYSWDSQTGGIGGTDYNNNSNGGIYQKLGAYGFAGATSDIDHRMANMAYYDTKAKALAHWTGSTTAPTLTTPVTAIPVGNNDRGPLQVQGTHRSAFRFVPKHDSAGVYEFYIPVNFDGATLSNGSKVGTATGFGSGDGGTAHIRLCTINSDGTPNLSNVIAQESFQSVARFESSSTLWNIPTSNLHMIYARPRTSSNGLPALTAQTPYALVFSNDSASANTNYFSINTVVSRGADMGPHRTGVFDGSAGMGRMGFDHREAFGHKAAEATGSWGWGSFANFAGTEDTSITGCRMPGPFGWRNDSAIGVISTTWPYQSDTPLQSCTMRMPPLQDDATFTEIGAFAYNLSTGAGVVKATNVTTGASVSYSGASNWTNKAINFVCQKGDVIELSASGTVGLATLEQSGMATFGNPPNEFPFTYSGTVTNGNGLTSEGYGMIDVYLLPWVWDDVAVPPSTLTVNDSIGNSDLSVSGTVIDSQASLVPSSSDKSMTFNGAKADGGMIHDYHGVSPYSIIVTLQPIAEDSQARTIISKIEHPGTVTETGYKIWHSTNGVTFARVSGGASDFVNDPSPLSTTYPELLICTYDGQTMSIYRQGSLRAFVTSTRSVAPFIIEPPFLVGAKEDGSMIYTGGVDELRVVPSAISAQQAASLYKAWNIITSSLAVNPTSITFNSRATDTTNPAAQTVSVTQNASGGDPNYSLTKSGALASDITLSAVSGQAPGNFTVSVNRNNRPQGNYSGVVTVTPNDANDAPINISVSLNVLASLKSVSNLVALAGNGRIIAQFDLPDPSLSADVVDYEVQVSTDGGVTWTTGWDPS